MTSIPASRRARAITLAPRSCPSRPGLAIRTRIGRSGMRRRVYLIARIREDEGVARPDPQTREDARGHPEPALADLEEALQHVRIAAPDLGPVVGDEPVLRRSRDLDERVADPELPARPP